eukprot:1539772-Prymnesium_polylepis.1
MRKLAEEVGAFVGARSLTARPGDTKLDRRHRRSMLPRSAAAPAAAPARLRRRAAVAASSHLLFTPVSRHRSVVEGVVVE